MFGCVLRSKHVVACLENRNDDEKGFDSGWFLSTCSRSVTIIDSHQRQCNSGNSLDTSKQPEISRFLQVTPILLSLCFIGQNNNNVIGYFDEWFLCRILVGPPLELIVLASKVNIPGNIIYWCVTLFAA